MITDYRYGHPIGGRLAPGKESMPQTRVHVASVVEFPIHQPSRWIWGQPSRRRLHKVALTMAVVVLLFIGFAGYAGYCAYAEGCAKDHVRALALLPKL